MDNKCSKIIWEITNCLGSDSVRMIWKDQRKLMKIIKVRICLIRSLDLTTSIHCNPDRKSLPNLIRHSNHQKIPNLSSLSQIQNSFARTKTKDSTQKICAMPVISGSARLKWLLIASTQISLTTPTGYAKTATYLSTIKKENLSC